MATEHTAEVRTFVYRANGRRVGWVRRGGPRSWWASDGLASSVYADRRGGYEITEGAQSYAWAFPRPSGQRKRYVVYDSVRPPDPTNHVFERVSATRWRILRGGRVIAFTKGPDGVAAALGFYYCGDGLLPD